MVCKGICGVETAAAAAGLTTGLRTVSAFNVVVILSGMAEFSSLFDEGESNLYLLSNPRDGSEGRLSGVWVDFETDPSLDLNSPSGSRLELVVETKLASSDILMVICWQEWRSNIFSFFDFALILQTFF